MLNLKKCWAYRSRQPELSQPILKRHTMSSQAFICDAIRTPFGRYGGALSSVRTDDLGAVPLRALMARNPKVDWQATVSYTHLTLPTIYSV